jgi:uncharacterized repeat protein (TIGR03803 family)
MTTKLQQNRARISRVAVAALSWAMAIAPAMLAAPPAAAQTFKLLYAFSGGSDGGGPYGTPLFTGGDVYCTTFYGGGAVQAGTVFEYAPNLSAGFPLYAFAGPPYDGGAPMAGLVTDGFGNFFGTLTQGGFTGHGMAFEFSQGAESPVEVFNGTDGDNPEGSLFIDSQSDLYGTTSQGGANDSGTVFDYSGSGGGFTQLYSFGNHSGDGVGPASSVVPQVLKNGELVVYGTTTEGGAYGWGTVFSFNIKTRLETVLYSFHGLKDGGTPVGGLVLYGSNLFGTASAGGDNNGTAGNGVVFKLNTKTGAHSVVHTFTGADGSEPLATLLSDGKGDFYGTTYIGGAHGYGTVFELNSTGTLTTLYSFTNGTDGAYPYAGLGMDSSGNLYGAAAAGGQYASGTLFEITP